VSSNLQIGLAVMVSLAVVLVCISPLVNLPSSLLRSRQGTLVALAIAFAAQRLLLRRSSESFQMVPDTSFSLTPFSGLSTLACALLC
jgi:hypothetical protein